MDDMNRRHFFFQQKVICLKNEIEVDFDGHPTKTHTFNKPVFILGLWLEHELMSLSSLMPGCPLFLKTGEHFLGHFFFQQKVICLKNEIELDFETHNGC